jgi:uncharacterized membrane protein
MEFLSQLLLIPALAAPIFIGMGIISKKFPPRHINSVYGYRTSRSMKSQERWDFAQSYSANEMIKLGSLLLLTSLFGLALNLSEWLEIALGFGLMIAMVIVFVIRTEKAIQNKFEKE